MLHVEAWVIAVICAAFALPVVLVRTASLSLDSLRRARGYVLVIAFIIAALLTDTPRIPPSAVEAAFGAILIYMGYEAGFRFARTLPGRRR